MIAALERGPETAPLNHRQRALVNYALKLTKTPQEISEHDTEDLRAVGLSDRSIHDLVAVTGYFNFVNRMASGLGVELE